MAMNVGLGLGLFLMGAGIGALLTAIAYSGRIRELRSEIEVMAHDHKRNHEDAA